jgi:hypothetical protein
MGCGKCSNFLLEKPNHNFPAIHINDQPIDLSEWPKATPVRRVTRLQDPLYGTDIVIKSNKAKKPQSMTENDLEA